MDYPTILVHGYAGKELSHWLKWLEANLAETSKVYFPSYQNSMAPIMKDWIDLYSDTIVNEKVYNFVAHSFGSLVTFKLIETHTIKVQNALLVACPENSIKANKQLLDKVDNESKAKLIQFIENVYDWELIKSRIKNLTFFYSDDDFAIPYKETLQFYKNVFPQANFKSFHNYGHFNRKNNINTLPEVFEYLNN